MRTMLRTSCYAMLTLLLGTERTAAQSSINGDRFWFGFMDNSGTGPSGQLLVHISSAEPTTGTIRMPRTGWFTAFSVPANGTASALIPWSAICSLSDSVEGKGILIESAHPVTVQALNQKYGSADASIILPESLLGTDHRIMAYPGQPGFISYNAEMLVVATEDSTLVEIVPTCPTTGGHPAGVPFTVLLDQGETYLLRATTAFDDLTGSMVRIPAPIGCQRLAVFGGSQCAKVPSTCTYCDHLYEQMIPLQDWGTHYSLAPFTGPDSYTYRILASQDSTSCTVNGVLQPMLMGGQYQEVNQVMQASCIEADKPVCVAQYMQGGNCSGGQGDPAMVLLPNDDALTTSVTFSTFSTPNLTLHELNIVTDSANVGLITVDGVLIPAQAYTPFSACNDRVWVSVPLVDGTHTVQGSSGFTGIVYGTGEYDASYAFPLGPASLPVLDSLICSDTSTVTLTAPSGFGLAIWSYEDTPYDTLAIGSTFTYTPSGNASITVRDTTSSTICDGAGRYRFEFNDPLTVSLTVDANSYCAPAQISLAALVVPDSLNVGYTWSPMIQRMNEACDSATASIMEPTLFQVTVVSPFGCFLAMDTVTVVAFPVEIPVITVVGGTLVSSPAAGYAWYLNNMGLPFASFQSFTPTMSGYYVVGTVDANGCLALSDPIYFAYNSIAEEEQISFQAWSTGDGALRIEAPQVLDQVEILTVLGQPVAMLEPHSTMVTVPVNGSGVYLVRVRSGSLVGGRKVAMIR